MFLIFSTCPPPPPHLLSAILPLCVAALSTLDALSTSTAKRDKKLLLQVNDLRAKIVESDVEILHGVNLTVNEGEVHAIMGKNSSGKSTFAKVFVGHPDYEVTGGSVLFRRDNLLDMEPEEKAQVGIFMSFQSPVEIPGVSNYDCLVMAYNARQRKLGQPERGPLEEASESLIQHEQKNAGAPPLKEVGRGSNKDPIPVSNLVQRHWLIIQLNHLLWYHLTRH